MTGIETEKRPEYRKALDRRPWMVHFEVADQCRALFPKWLMERGGIIVYENHMMDSSHLGETTFMPSKFVAEEDDKLHWAPLENRPDGGLPSLRQQQVDLVELSDYVDPARHVDAVIEQVFAFEYAKKGGKG